MPGRELLDPVAVRLARDRPVRQGVAVDVGSATRAEVFAAWLTARKVRVMPGTLFGMPEHFRPCLTATREMVTRALPAFEEAAGLPWRD